ncbi:interleukin 37 [Ictidomys tridecemlineatus]|uniref:Interleukin-1 n=1 Tax=Ictidomys tridecemlineatus TaxID=43179 RepID=I3MC07_ICTTR|nr:interleukin-37 [Ictidomys tridecemlineatus]XP_040126652.1 interleukin-37 [Ictidomys tridecemlineatus]KAG3268004.1 interleukin 37 [Ictidomys tridecemlineatus]
MSFLEDNTGENMDFEDWEEEEAQCCSEDPAGSPMETGQSQASVSSVHTSPRVKAKEPQKFSIFDRDHKVLVLDSGTLKAIPHKSYILPETFFVLASHLAKPSEEKGSPILLAVSKGEFCLCCDKNKGKRKPSLQLKKKKLMSLAAQKETSRRAYVFYKSKVGSRYTLESAAHPGWFICTSRNSGDPVTVTDKTGRRKHTEFSFENPSKTEMSQ